MLSRPVPLSLLRFRRGGIPAAPAAVTTETGPRLGLCSLRVAAGLLNLRTAAGLLALRTSAGLLCRRTGVPNAVLGASKLAELLCGRSDLRARGTAIEVANLPFPIDRCNGEIVFLLGTTAAPLLLRLLLLGEGKSLPRSESCNERRRRNDGVAGDAGAGGNEDRLRGRQGVTALHLGFSTTSRCHSLQ